MGHSRDRIGHGFSQKSCWVILKESMLRTIANYQGWLNCYLNSSLIEFHTAYSILIKQIFNFYILNYDGIFQVHHQLNSRKRDEVEPKPKNRNENSKKPIENRKLKNIKPHRNEHKRV
jgi:large-conductance mechanosensitive channel